MIGWAAMIAGPSGTITYPAFPERTDSKENNPGIEVIRDTVVGGTDSMIPAAGFIRVAYLSELSRRKNSSISTPRLLIEA